MASWLRITYFRAFLCLGGRLLGATLTGAWVISVTAAATATATTGSSASPAPSALLTEAPYWQKIPSLRPLAEQLISNGNCHIDAQYLNACVQAVNAAGRLLDNPLTIRALPDLPVQRGATSAALPEQLSLTYEQAAQEFLKTHADASDPGRLDFLGLLDVIAEQLPSNMPAAQMWGIAITAHLRGFDPYAEIQPRTLYKDKRSHLFRQDQFGFSVVPTTLGPRVREILDPSPASKANLKVNDLITGISTDGIRFEAPQADVRTQLDALAASTPKMPLGLRITRENTTQDLNIVSSKDLTPAVTSQTLEVDRTTVGYLRIREFESRDTCTEVQKRLRMFANNRIDRLVLDLRDNPGGSKDAAICIAGLFIGPQRVLAREALNLWPSLAQIQRASTRNQSRLQWERSTSQQIAKGPLVVLVDDQSASAAEILAGALQDSKRATLVGLTTFGKGVLQSHDPLPGFNQLIFSRTTARYLLPSERNIDGVGLTPHFPALFHPDQLAETPSSEVTAERERLELQCLQPRKLRDLTQSVLRDMDWQDDQLKTALGVALCL